MSAFTTAVHALIDAHRLVVLHPRESYRAAEVGVTLDGRLIYDRERLIEAFMAVNGWGEDDAIAWVDFNIASTPQVLLV